MSRISQFLRARHTRLTYLLLSQSGLYPLGARRSVSALLISFCPRVSVRLSAPASAAQSRVCAADNFFFRRRPFRQCAAESGSPRFLRRNWVAGPPERAHGKRARARRLLRVLQRVRSYMLVYIYVYYIHVHARLFQRRAMIDSPAIVAYT